MSYYPLSVRNLIKNLSKLPGIGEKTAERLAMQFCACPERKPNSCPGVFGKSRRKPDFAPSVSP